MSEPGLSVGCPMLAHVDVLLEDVQIGCVEDQVAHPELIGATLMNIGISHLLGDPLGEAYCHVDVVLEVTYQVSRSHEVGDVELALADDEVVPERARKSLIITLASVLRMPDGQISLSSIGTLAKSIDYIV